MLTGPVKHAWGKLSNPERLYIDLASARLGRDVQKNIAVNDSFVKSIRVGQHRPGTVRVVLDLASGYHAHAIASITHPFRVIIKMTGGDALVSPLRQTADKDRQENDKVETVMPAMKSAPTDLKDGIVGEIAEVSPTPADSGPKPAVEDSPTLQPDDPGTREIVEVPLKEGVDSEPPPVKPLPAEVVTVTVADTAPTLPRVDRGKDDREDLPLKDGAPAFVERKSSSSEKTPETIVAVSEQPPKDDSKKVQEILSAQRFFFMPTSDSPNTAEAASAAGSSQEGILPAPAFVAIDLREYIEKVLNANPAVKISEQDYRKSMITFLRDIQNYDFKVSIGSTPSYSYQGSTIQGASGFTDESEMGVNAYLYVTKNLYDGGKKQILEKEYDVFRALSQADQLQKNDTVILTAVNYYTNFYYQQQVREFLTQQFTQYRVFQDQVEKKYRRGVRFTTYDLLTTQADSLRLERGLIDQKAGLIKVETAFRQYGQIYSEEPLRLAPLEVAFAPEIEGLQKYAVVHSSAIHAARLRSELQEYKVKEREAERGPKVDITAAVGWQAGSGGYSGANNLLADAYLSFSLPLYDGGVVKSQIMAEKIELVRQKFTLQKVTDDTIRMLNDLYVDYKNFEASMEVLKQLIDLDERRLRVSLERLDKGLDDYRGVRDSWREFIDAKMEYLRQAAISQKILLDLSILSGKKIVN